MFSISTAPLDVHVTRHFVETAAHNDVHDEQFASEQPSTQPDVHPVSQESVHPETQLEVHLLQELVHHKQYGVIPVSSWNTSIFNNSSIFICFPLLSIKIYILHFLCCQLSICYFLVKRFNIYRQNGACKFKNKCLNIAIPLSFEKYAYLYRVESN